METWQHKDRTYILSGIKQPLVFTVPGRHSRKRPLLWWDDEKGEQRELRYATNQNSPFVDEQKGQITLGRIVFRNGSLFVPAKQQNLQKLLSLYHPLKDKMYYEHDEQVIAHDQLDVINLEVDALIAAKQLSVDEAEAVLRAEYGNQVSSMTSKEIQRDILLFAKHRSELFLKLVQDDDIHLRNFAIKAVEANIIKLASDNRSFQWASNGRKLFEVPFEEHPYSAISAWFKTDDGLEVVKAIEKRLQ